MSAMETPGLDEAARLQRDLYLYWASVARADGVALTGRGFMPRPTLRRLREELAVGEAAGPDASESDASETDLPRLLFIRRALERLGLLRAGGAGETQRLEAAETRAMARYLARPLAERVRMLTRLWMGGAWWPDRLDPRAGLPGLLMPAAPRVAIARRRLIEEIAGLAPGEIVPAPQTWRPARASGIHARAAMRRRTPSRPLRPRGIDAGG